MRASSTLLIVYFCIYLLRDSKADKFYNGGWMPLLHEEVFRRMKIQPREIDNIAKSWHPSEVFPQNVHPLKNDVIKLVNPLPIHTEFAMKRRPFSEENLFRMNELERSSECKGKDSANCPETGGGGIVELFDDTHFEDESAVGKNVRVAKKIADYSKNLTQDEKVPNVPEESAKSKSLIREVRLSSDKGPTYEVTEKPEELDMLNDDQSTIQTGYVYNRPDLKTNSKPNTTNPFLNILSKYKNKKDEANYILSRKLKNQNEKPEFIYVPIPLRPRSFNSLNHLPVNPMLAVFLSNYGYYLPGAYGARNNFSNLYGYLASNNLHNNLPYGMYKVFSDTDSSN